MINENLPASRAQQIEDDKERDDRFEYESNKGDNAHHEQLIKKNEEGKNNDR